MSRTQSIEEKNVNAKLMSFISKMIGKQAFAKFLDDGAKIVFTS